MQRNLSRQMIFTQPAARQADLAEFAIRGEQKQNKPNLKIFKIRWKTVENTS